jgi:hypothetical protein
MDTQVTTETPSKPACLHAEAGIVAFTAFVLDGVCWSVTLREGTTADQTLALLRECYRVQEALAKAGATFVLNRDARETLERRAGKTAEKPATQPTNGHDQPTNGHDQATAGADPAWCKVHNVEMQRWERDGRAWLSHKTEDGAWCRGKPRNGNGHK